MGRVLTPHVMRNPCAAFSTGQAFTAVFTVIAVGYFWGRRAQPDMAIVDRISMNVLAPALIFSALENPEVDPRIALAIELGAEARLGQVSRMMRSDVDLSPVGAFGLGRTGAGGAIG